MADAQTMQQIEQLRGSLSEKLAELHRRATETRELLTPAHYWRSPWLKVGAGVALGMMVAGGRRDGGLSFLGATVAAALGGLVVHVLATPPSKP